MIFSCFRRNCYFSDEGSLKYFMKYSLESCLHECRSEMALKTCGCIPISNIRKSLNHSWNNKKVKSAGGSNDSICDHEDMDCVKKSWRDNSTDFEKFCGCLPECNKIEYNFEVIEERRTSSYHQYFFTNLSASIYFKDDEFTAYRRVESYGAVRLLSNIGGLLGLFLGISLLSVVEVVYFIALRLFDDIWLHFIRPKF